VSERIVVVVGLVVVVVTFFNHNFVSCKATLILEIKNVLNKIQCKPICCSLLSLCCCKPPAEGQSDVVNRSVMSRHCGDTSVCDVTSVADASLVRLIV